MLNIDVVFVVMHVNSVDTNIKKVFINKIFTLRNKKRNLLDYLFQKRKQLGICMDYKQNSLSQRKGRL